MTERGMIVAIDGPAGAGKTTVSKRVAEALGFTRVDTGAIYRAVALASLRRSLSREEDIAALAAGLDLRFEGAEVYLFGERVTEALRTPEISQQASKVSALRRVRGALLDLQRRIARESPQGAVLEGRDIGTVVFPDADFKFFLVASKEERARRRTAELEERGTPQSFEEVLKEMEERDLRDSTRETAPLKKADDAIEIDTTGLGIEEVIERIVAGVRAGSS